MSDETGLGRFLIWIDGVGGYLVCPGAAVTFGQALPASTVDVPIMADLRRHHATIRRDAEGYVAEPFGVTSLAGRRLSAPAALGDGDLLELSEVALRFRRSHPLSATARLEFVSSHRVRPTCDAVLMMSEACILGPGPASHVMCRAWPRDVVLVRRPQGLACQTAGRLEIDRRELSDRGPLLANSHVRGDGFSFSLEPVG